MRISLRLQLAILLVLSGAIGLAVLAIATWVVNHDFVLSVSSSRLEITASLKAAQVAYNLELMQIGATFLTTRNSIQEALVRYNNGSNTTSENWADAISNLATTLGNTGPLSSALVLQCQVFAVNSSCPAGTGSVMNVTGANFNSIILPWQDSDGSPAYLGEADSGYPPALYPNLTVYQDPGEQPHATYEGMDLGLESTLVLGPLNINSTFALLSLTLPVVNNTATDIIVGWVTVVTDAHLIREVVKDERGLGETGQTLLLGPLNKTNNFPDNIIGNESAAGTTFVQYLIPLNQSSEDRHPTHVYGTKNAPFEASRYPAVRRSIVEDHRGVNDVGSMMRTHNEAGKKVSVGYSTAPTKLVDWIVVVEQAHSEVWKPINRLRTIILACLFGVIGFMCIVSFPIAHWAVSPLMRLRAASAETIVSRGGSFSGSTDSLSSKDRNDRGEDMKSDAVAKQGFLAATMAKVKAKKQAYYHVERRSETRSRIPGKVPLRKHWIKDEMYDLVLTFNEMSDELLSQYTKLEDRVRQRTEELEHSKKAAEAANESKTLFVANVSHELRTPLNGILGLTAICMEEDDPLLIKKSLGTIYKSGELLLRTLTDLLSFSTNQVGLQALTLDEKEFAIRDLELQTTAIFGEQAKDNHVDLRVIFEETPGDIYGIGKLRDIAVYGDIHRILQVIINLVSNALKFTPVGGSVTLTIKCLMELPNRKTSLRGRRTLATQFVLSPSSTGPESGTANFINPVEPSEAQTAAQERIKSLPPGRDLVVQLEVQDTGPGVEDEMLQRIFEPFVQADAGLSRKHSGTGLGLSISSQLVSLMGGTIGLQSKLGEGCLFTVKLPLRLVLGSATPRSSRDFSLPISRMPSVTRMPTITNGRTPDSEITLVGTLNTNSTSPGSTTQRSIAETPSDQPDRPLPGRRASKSTTAAAQPDFSKAKVLVAEDNRVNQEVILRMLKLEKILNVTIAADGKEALDAVTNCEGECPAYDLIFMDIQMPNMDGLSAAKLIREAGYTRPIVALTAFADQSNIDQCYGSGMDDFVSKPIKRPLLKKVLSKYCLPAIKESKQDPDQIAEDASAAEGQDSPL